MKKKILSCIVVICMLFSSVAVFAAEDKADVIILFENDVHCAIDGYAKLAALKADMKNEADYVAVVSAGDFVQGGNAGVVSKGEYIVNLMNIIGYDATTLGNHEFDYRIPRLLELSEMLETKIVCSNFKTVDGEEVFNPYTIVSYGDFDVAYIGVTTPNTLTSSFPSQFLDANGEYAYSFSGNDFYSGVQSSIDEAEEKGAEYIVALSHLGTENGKEEWLSQALVKNTSGLDVVLDGHSHSVVENMTVEDKNGNGVIISSTGTAFANIGKLTIDNGKIKTELIPTETLTNIDESVDKYIGVINEEIEESGNRVIGKSEVLLTTKDENGNRIVRNAETNLGDFCADAYREITGADIGVVNGGGIRTDIEIGEITFNDILAVFPFNNVTCVAEVTGQKILDMLELGVINYPDEDGSFQHVSGIKFDINSGIKSAVVLDENTNFVKVDGEYRVHNVTVLNKETGEYESLDTEKLYTLASHNYLLLECGGGMTMFKEVKGIVNTGIIDVELLENYISENMNGVIGEAYAEPQNRINIVSDGNVLFDDVKNTDWYYDAVAYAVENKLFKGISDKAFSPDGDVTRGMLVTVLYRAEGEPATNRSIPFADIEMGEYYANAVTWAQQNGIVVGVTQNEFAPDENVTREQIAAIMHRYAQYKAYDVSVGENTNILSYVDAFYISEYAIPAVQYVCGAGIMKGKTESTINPKDNATRAEVAAILKRFMENNADIS